MKFQKTLLAAAVALASSQLSALDIFDTLPQLVLDTNADNQHVLITSDGSVYSTGDNDAITTEQDPGPANAVTILSITNNGFIESTGDGILISNEDTVSGAITNNNALYLTGQAWGAAISIAGTVGGGIVNGTNGIIDVSPTGCDDTLCLGGGIGVYGTAAVSGGITNNGSITSSSSNMGQGQGPTPNPWQDGGIKLLAIVDANTNALLGSPTVNGNITNDGDITAERTGIQISGATVNGNIVNESTGTITADSAIRINANAAQLDQQTDNGVGVLGDGEDLQGNEVDEVGPVPTTINGSIINKGTLTGSGTDGITFTGNVTVSGNLQNIGTIEATGNDGVGAIYLEGGGTNIQGGINNSGSITVAAGNSTYLANPEHAAIYVGQGDSVSVITNSGTIENQGYTSGGYAIATQGGSIGTIENANGGTINGAVTVQNGTIGLVKNSGIVNGVISAGQGGSIGSVESANGGTINGAVDFGSAGGLYYFTGGSQNGQIINATTIHIGNYGQQGINSNESILTGNLTHAGAIVVDAVGVDLGNGETRVDNGLLYVEGNVNVNNATVNVNVTNEQFIKPGDSLDVIHASGTLTSAGAVIADNSALLAFDLSQTEINGVESIYQALQATAKNADLGNTAGEAGVDTSSAGFRNTANVFVALQSIDQSTVESDSDLDQLLDILNTGGLTTEQTIAAAETLDAEIVEGAAVGSQAADAAAAATVDRRISALRDSAQTGMVAGDLLSVHGFWVQGYYNDTEQDNRDDVNGFDADTTGIAMGVDAAINDQVNAGVAFSWANTRVDSEGVEQNKMDIDSYRLALYSAYNAENYYVDGQVAYSSNDYDSKRNVTVGSYNAVAKSNHKGDQYSLRVRSGYPMALDNGLYVTPRAGLEYTYLSEEDYKEKGAGNAGLAVRTDDVEVLLAKLGAKVMYPIVTESEVTWIPEVSMDVVHDFIGDEVELDSNFLGAAAAAFVTQGANIEKTGVTAGLRVRAFSQSNFSFSAGYDYLYKKDYASQSLNATVRYDF